ncbi:hypothetical protein PIROE2DRAFT_2006 [Piromyces sp. E2]|nr:hypothetical protein PIROE2DRAFT_2006 [Piromyces sp. E2]|eukprot:OUM70050.1 hypothetical protein PIROE2DRAFT_2006 [Piromyces sp. E2]
MNNIYAHNNNIKILIGKSDVKEKGYLEKYNQKIKEYLTSKGTLSKYNVEFSYCKPEPSDGVIVIEYIGYLKYDLEYSRNYNCTLRALKGEEYDMFILDNEFFFSDNSKATNVVLNGYYRMLRLSEYYYDYNSHVESIELNHHDKKILEEGYINDNLYGLPYEVDFNLLYYHENYSSFKDILSNDVSNSISNDISNNISNSTINLDNNTVKNILSNDIPNTISNSTINLDDNASNQDGLLSIGLKNNDELLSTFAEYLSYKYDITNENKNPLDIFFKPNNVVADFKNYLMKYTGFNITKTLETDLRQAYNSFINQEKILFKGKASYYKDLKNNPNISVFPNALPKNRSAFQQKYLVINKNTLKPINDLISLALELTSIEMQNYRADVFGTVPTFDIKNEADVNVKAYCAKNLDICNVYRKIEPIRMDQFFIKNDFSANYLETRAFLPSFLNQNIMNSTVNDTENFNILIRNILNDEKASNNEYKYFIGDYANFILIIGFVIIIFLVMKNRKHPYLKVISPKLATLNIVGYIINLSSYIFYKNSDTKFLCHCNLIYKVIGINLTFLPIIAIIFRIYYIYTNISEVNYGKKVNDNRLFIAMSIMTYKTFKVSRKKGEIKFIFLIVLILFLDIMYEISYFFLGSFNTGVVVYIIISQSLYIIGSVYYVYLLVGARLIYVIKHPIKNGAFNGNSVYNDYFDITINLVDFIPLKKEEKSKYTCFGKRNKYAINKKEKDYKYNILNNNYNHNNKFSNYPNNINFNNNNNNNNNNINNNINNNNINNNNINNNSMTYYNNIKNSESINTYINSYISNYTDYINNYNNNKLNNNNNNNTNINTNSNTTTTINTNNSNNNSNNTSNTTITTTNNNDEFSKYLEDIDNNPNNYFFNQSLKMLTEQNDTDNYYYRKKE